MFVAGSLTPLSAAQAQLLAGGIFQQLVVYSFKNPIEEKLAAYRESALDCQLGWLYMNVDARAIY